MSDDYNAANPSAFSFEDCEAMVGRRATLTLTGWIIEASDTDAGPFVRFQIDERWGFGRALTTIGLDLDALQVEMD